MKIFLFIILIPVFGVAMFSLRHCDTASEVLHEQTNARTLLKKYEWFKDASSVLDKKRADLSVYETRSKNLKSEYEGQPRSKWAREDRSQLSVWASEQAGISASYNQLASEYNSAMSKINWAFTNAGQLPKGATETLPREFKPYISE